MSEQQGSAAQNGIDGFRAATENLQWDPDHVAASLQALFKVVSQLAVIDVGLYQKRAKSQHSLSRWLRWGGAIFGMLGVLSPALIATGEETAKCIAKWGYVCFALAGSAFAINSMFGGTTGHARYVIARLKLEEVIVRYGVKWARYSAAANAAPSAATGQQTAGQPPATQPPAVPSPESQPAEAQPPAAQPAAQPAANSASAATPVSKTDEGFELILGFLNEYATIVQNETLQWAQDMINDVRTFAVNHDKTDRPK